MKTKKKYPSPLLILSYLIILFVIVPIVFNHVNPYLAIMILIILFYTITKTIFKYTQNKQ